MTESTRNAFDAQTVSVKGDGITADDLGVDEKKLKRIHDLLSRADKDMNNSEAESDLAAQRARKEASKLNITIQQARDARDSRGTQERPVLSRIKTSDGVVPSYRKDFARLFALIAEVQYCDSRIYPKGEVEIVGFRSDITLTKTLFSFIAPQMEEALANYFNSSAFERESDRSGKTKNDLAKDFLFSFSDVIFLRLQKAREEAESEVEEETGISTALVLASKRERVEDASQEFYGKDKKQVGTRRQGRAANAGRKAAETAIIAGNAGEIGE